MGIAKDLGKCKGVRKSDSHPCSNFVNRYKFMVMSWILNLLNVAKPLNHELGVRTRTII